MLIYYLLIKNLFHVGVVRAINQLLESNSFSSVFICSLVDFAIYTFAEINALITREFGGRYHFRDYLGGIHSCLVQYVMLMSKNITYLLFLNYYKIFAQHTIYIRSANNFTPLNFRSNNSED
jgi:hypothetical protein